MQEDKNKDLLVKELKEKLDWYTLFASEEEYDAGAVESILYLLDRLEPIEENDIPRKSEAWERFQELACRQEELLPVPEMRGDRTEKACRAGEKGREVSDAAAPENGMGEAAGTDEPKDGMGEMHAVKEKKASEFRKFRAPDTADFGAEISAELGISGFSVSKAGACLPKTGSIRFFGTGCPAQGRFTAGMWHFAMGHKYIAATIVIALILAVSGTAEAIATGGNDFFYWLEQDDTGTKMMTSPTDLEAETDTNECTYLSREEMPDWTQEWLEIEEKFEMPEGYEWQYYEAGEVEYRKYVGSNYQNVLRKDEIFLGAWIYQEKISYHEESFVGYNYIDDYGEASQKMGIYCKTEETGDIFYIISFYEGNCQYYIRGQDDLENLKVLAEQYWNCVKTSKKV
nr:hypothetical protein [uncultured Acetatifactor sp.]